MTRPLLALSLLCAVGAAAQNPLITDQFTADPTARVFGDRVYVYPSHDVNCGTDWFCMKDYHAFSSEDLVTWTDHGEILHQDDVPWVDASQNAMWAPDAVEKDGRYYFYFPAIGDSTTDARGRRIGVATASAPGGPFTPEPMPMEGVGGIDPNVLIDDDGQAYLYWSGRGLSGARLSDDMMSLASEPVRLDASFPEGFKEGPFVFKRDGTYYFTFPHVIHETEALAYATGPSPLGPFTYRGVFMEEHASGCWTNHHSFVERDGQWLLFYHHNDLSPDFDKNRSIRADSVFFNPNGTIQKVTPTHRGVGLVDAREPIQVDRYSHTSGAGVNVSFLDPDDPHEGWSVALAQNGAWVQFDAVDVGAAPPASVRLRVRSESGGTVKVRVGRDGAYTTADIELDAGDGWRTVEAPIENVPTGVRDVWVSLRSDGMVEVDWVRFE
ncbi:family 43 glycosylhydrolase [Rubrivirga marina]|uniref:Alpha-N-arabinofuranosidase n=1 Tax=Rubrivirga marina TaxID=1196024 RepID=A0A271IWW4_9BACT|nr:family 43 glycosylhydrolase [Rubrivirga marina]PAP75039.1 alpha-N-arabinofuranosidase [Rubrivirga marina]